MNRFGKDFVGSMHFICELKIKEGEEFWKKKKRSQKLSGGR